MVVCVLLPRFELSVADPRPVRVQARRGPVALAPAPGGPQRVGEASPAAEAFGIGAGMAMGEALARCPALVLVPPDPAGVAEVWEEVLGRLEAIGAPVAPERPGLACFEARGLHGIHGGHLEGVIEAVCRALRRPVRIGAAASRFCALAAAHSARSRRAEIVVGGEAAARSYLASRPVALLGLAPDDPVARLVAPLERLGVRTLGELSRLPRAALADRFGAAGLRALELADGRDEPLRPRVAGERLSESLELPEAASGPQLERALGLLLDRIVARRERRGRTLRTVAISATLVEGGTWQERIVFREALADPARMRLALGLRLGLLPAPAERLVLAVERFGPPVSDQRALLGQADADRDSRLREAVRQTRTLAGPDAALRVVLVDPDSRVPERRTMLAPYES